MLRWAEKQLDKKWIQNICLKDLGLLSNLVLSTYSDDSQSSELLVGYKSMRRSSNATILCTFITEGDIQDGKKIKNSQASTEILGKPLSFLILKVFKQPRPKVP